MRTKKPNLLIVLPYSVPRFHCIVSLSHPRESRVLLPEHEGVTTKRFYQVLLAKPFPRHVVCGAAAVGRQRRFLHPKTPHKPIPSRLRRGVYLWFACIAVCSPCNFKNARYSGRLKLPSLGSAAAVVVMVTAGDSPGTRGLELVEAVPPSAVVFTVSRPSCFDVGCRMAAWARCASMI